MGLIVEPLQPETKCKIDAELYKLHKPQLEFIQCYRAFLIMGSLMSKIYDDMATEQWQNDKEWLQNLGEEIKDINPSSSEFRNLKWLQENKERILGNRRLIELLR